MAAAGLSLESNLLVKFGPSLLLLLLRQLLLLLLLLLLAEEQQQYGTFLLLGYTGNGTIAGWLAPCTDRRHIVAAAGRMVASSLYSTHFFLSSG